MWMTATLKKCTYDQLWSKHSPLPQRSTYQTSQESPAWRWELATVD